jgi:hypothetical protein
MWTLGFSPRILRRVAKDATGRKEGASTTGHEGREGRKEGASTTGHEGREGRKGMLMKNPLLPEEEWCEAPGWWEQGRKDNAKEGNRKRFESMNA